MSEEITTESQTEVTPQTESQSPEQEAPKNVLFAAISYNDEEAYEKFLQNMNLNQAVFVLVSSANFAQAKGSFNILESETLATAIRTIRKNSKPVESTIEPVTEN